MATVKTQWGDWGNYTRWCKDCDEVVPVRLAYMYDKHQCSHGHITTGEDYWNHQRDQEEQVKEIKEEKSELQKTIDMIKSGIWSPKGLDNFIAQAAQAEPITLESLNKMLKQLAKPPTMVMSQEMKQQALKALHKPMPIVVDPYVPPGKIYVINDQWIKADPNELGPFD